MVLEGEERRKREKKKRDRGDEKMKDRKYGEVCLSRDSNHGQWKYLHQILPTQTKYRRKNNRMMIQEDQEKEETPGLKVIGVGSTGVGTT